MILGIVFDILEFDRDGGGPRKAKMQKGQNRTCSNYQLCCAKGVPNGRDQLWPNPSLVSKCGSSLATCKKNRFGKETIKHEKWMKKIQK